MWLMREYSLGNGKTEQRAVFRDGNFEWELSAADMKLLTDWGISYGKPEPPPLEARLVRG